MLECERGHLNHWTNHRIYSSEGGPEGQCARLADDLSGSLNLNLSLRFQNQRIGIHRLGWLPSTKLGSGQTKDAEKQITVVD